MSKIKLLIAAALLATSMVAPADESIGITQEFLAKGFSFPSSATGTLEAKECSSCPTMRVQLTVDTRFQVAQEMVSYERLRETFEANPEALTFLVLDKDGRNVVSLFIGVSPPPPKR